jgi:NTE family protein
MQRPALQFSLADYIDWFLRGLKLDPAGGRIASELWQAYGRMDFRDLAVPFAVVAHDLGSGMRVVLSEGSVGQAVEASIRPPFLGRPVSLHSHELIDGGFQLPVPSDVVRGMGADIVIAVNLGAFIRLPPPLRSYAARLTRGAHGGPSHAAGLRSQFLFMCRLLSRQRLASPAADIEVRPNMRGISAFAPWQAGEAVRRGEIAARRALPAIKSALSRATSVGVG